MNRVQVFNAVASLHQHEGDEAQAIYEKIKAAVHEWPQDLIIETLLDGASAAKITPSDNHDKVTAYGLAFLTSNPEALAYGMAENMPESDAMTPSEIVGCLDDLIDINRKHFDRWGLGHLLTKG